MENKILVIGIAGGTGSGKTTLMNNIIRQFGDVVTVLSHDNYYRRRDDLTYDQRCLLNYDEPAALETDLMAEHLEQLRQVVRNSEAVESWQPNHTEAWDKAYERLLNTIKSIPGVQNTRTILILSTVKEDQSVDPDELLK